MIIAIDPGNIESAMIVWGNERIEMMRFDQNEEILAYLRAWCVGPHIVPLAIEMIGHYGTGMPAGKTVFDTCVWIGRFTEAYGADRTHYLLRPTIKAHLCGSARAKDQNVRAAILDRFGGKEKAIGKKAAPGLLYGVHSHMFSALAVALTFTDQHAERSAPALDALEVASR